MTIGQVVKELASAMREAHATRGKWSDGKVSLELELGSLPADVPAVPNDKPFGPDEDRCPCGHSIAVEHSESGCLRGCSETLCLSDAGEPKE